MGRGRRDLHTQSAALYAESMQNTQAIREKSMNQRVFSCAGTLQMTRCIQENGSLAAARAQRWSASRMSDE
jgi:hypothetical protein